MPSCDHHVSMPSTGTSPPVAWRSIPAGQWDMSTDMDIVEPHRPERRRATHLNRWFPKDVKDPIEKIKKNQKKSQI